MGTPRSISARVDAGQRRPFAILRPLGLSVITSLLALACGGSGAAWTSSDPVPSVPRAPTEEAPTPALTPLGVLGGSADEGLRLSTLRRVAPTYDIREVTATRPIDPSLRALLVVDLRTPLSQAEVRAITDYVSNGGSLGVLGGSMGVDLAAAPDLRAVPTSSGVNRLLTSWGIALCENIVADSQCARVPLRTGGIATPAAYPPAPMPRFERSAVLACSGVVPLFWVSAITTSAAFATRHGVVLVQSSAGDQSWLLEASPVDVRIREPQTWAATQTGAPPGPFVLAVAAEEGPSRVLVVGTATTILDDLLPPADRFPEAELVTRMAFTLDAIDWLAHESNRIAIRASGCDEDAAD